MNVAQLLSDLRDRDVTLWAEGDRLRYRAPKDVLTPAQLDSIKKHKTDILEILRTDAGEDGTCALSYGQRALWFLYQLAPESAAYNMLYIARLRNDVDAQVLEEVFASLAKRHAALQTTYTTRNGEPIQQVHPNTELRIEQIDTSGWSNEKLSNWIGEEADGPFDLEKGPVARVQLLLGKIPKLMITTHHIAFDFWSLEILVDEACALYESIEKDQQASLQPLAWQYKDYVAWQTRWLESSEGEKAWAFWKARLGGELPVLNLPTDRSRPVVQTYHGQSYSFVLSQEISGQIREFATNSGATLYMTMLAAYQVFLLQHTGQEDILIGSPMSGRTRAELEGIYGYFVNPVVIRSDLSGDPSFKTLLNRVRHAVLDSLEHQDFPFSVLVERLQPARDPSRSPLFQAAFAWDRLRGKPGSKQPGANAHSIIRETLDACQRGAAFDLQLVILDSGDELKCSWEYNTDLFNRDTIQRMVGHFNVLLENMVADPEKPVSLLPLLTTKERQRLLVDWNDTERAYSKGKCIHELVEAQVERTPSRIAVDLEGKTLTYRDLDRRANRLGRYLQSLGVGPETLVGLFAERSLEMVVGLLGILKAGGAYVPLDPEYPEERLALMMSDAEVRVLLTQEKFIERLPRQDVPIICLDKDWKHVAQGNASKLKERAKPDNLAYVIYTSGSTGKPKGAMNTHRGVCNRLLWMQEEYNLGEEDTILQKTPFSFDVSVWEFFWPLLTGARMVLARPGGHKDTGYLVQIIHDQQITVMHYVPSMLRLFLEEKNLHFCNSLRDVICSGEVLPVELQERFFTRLDANLHNLYGPTEAAIDVTFWRCERNGHRTTVPIGRPVANTRIYVLDARLRPTPIGVPGELHIGGVQVGRGYLNRPKLTEQRFIRDPFVDEPAARLYKTGDLARYLPDGSIEYLKRMDQQVKIRGFRIEPGEIESALTTHPGVKAAAVVAQEYGSDNRRLVAYLVPDDTRARPILEGQDAEPSKLINSVRRLVSATLPEHMMPGAFVLLDELPLTPSGKLDRRALPKPNQERPSLEESYVGPSDELEETLAGIWSDVLHVDQVGTHDNFFDLGGHSLLAVRMVVEIEKVYGKHLPLATLFEAPTVEQLAGILRKKKWSPSWSCLVPIRPGGTNPPLYLMHSHGGNVLEYYPLARWLGEDQPVYALQARGLDGNIEKEPRIEKMVAHYLKEIKSLQPEGPYYLGGFCLGGFLALEAAQQLKAGGDEVALLVMIDTRSTAPRYIPGTRTLRRWGYALANRFDIEVCSMTALGSKEKLRFFWRRLIRLRALIQARIEKVIEAVRSRLNLKSSRRSLAYPPEALGEAHTRAAQNYEKRPFDGRTVLFRASKQPRGFEFDASYGWDEWIDEAGFTVDEAPGMLHTMLREPNVRILAEKLRTWLSESPDPDRSTGCE